MTFTAPRGALGRIGAIAALATALALLAAPPGLADEADDRLTLMRAAQVGGPAGAGDVTAAQQTAAACATDPTGDVVDERADGDPATHAQADRADIVEHCASYVDNLMLRVRVAAPTNPHSDPVWQDATFVGWFLDTTGNGVGDYFASYNLNPAGVLVTTVQRLEDEATATVTCDDAPAVYDGTSYTAGPIPPECLDEATDVAVAAATFYDVEGQGGPLLHDTAPVGGTFSAPVQRDMNCTDPLPGPFADRNSIASVHRHAVDCLFSRGVVLGTDIDGVRRFQPLLAIPRGQFAAFTFRGLRATDTTLPPAQTPRFTDVAAGSTFDQEIHRLAAADILLGVTPRQFRPHDQIRRDQTASVLVRSLAHARDAAVTPAAPGTHFSDTVGNIHAANIDAAFEEEIVRGIVAPSPGARGLYVPAAPTSRQQMASVINRFVDNVEGS